MPQYPDSALAPPQKIDDPFDKVIGGRIWVDSASLLSSMYVPSLMRFCSDEECSLLSGTPERSLRLLQTARIIHATKAPLPGGSYKRVWHLPEVVAAAVVENIKAATNIDYATVAKISFEGSLIARMLFVDYLDMHKQRIGDEFSASLMLTPTHAVCLQINPALQTIDPELRKLSVGNGFIPVSSVKDGKSQTIERSAQRVKQFVAEFESAKFYTVINLKNVFEQFERDARKMRK
jgi:hypothetical protein